MTSLFRTNIFLRAAVISIFGKFARDFYEVTERFL